MMSTMGSKPNTPIRKYSKYLCSVLFIAPHLVIRLAAGNAALSWTEAAACARQSEAARR
jgi:hypothetical protein